jgi:uroporphyrinogen decarboxylase
MNDRQRFIATMHYQPRDRSPICDFGFWPETIELWHAQGLPDWVGGGHDTVSTDKYFGMDHWGGGIGGDNGMRPGFEEKIIEDRGDHEVFMQSTGVTVLRKKQMGSIPTHLSHTLTDRESWNKHFKWRLNPDTPGRLPDLAAARKVWNDPNYPAPRTASGGSLYGWLRDWMGMENLSYVVHDDPAWFEEMVVTLGDLTVSVLTRLYEAGAQFDACSFWEDMCYRAGPLLSPEHFKRYLVPQYRRITSLLRSHGCDVIYLDCDGCIDALLPLWLDAGVNCMFPVEIGTWNADPVAYRKQYGRDLLMLGGFDKHILARTPRDIEHEIRRLTPLVEEGGFIGFADHRVPPDVPFENYMFYLRTVRAIWGKGVDLKPLGQRD